VADTGLHSHEVNFCNLIGSDLLFQNATASCLENFPWFVAADSRSSTFATNILLQPPRTRHCHDCDKCVLQFDHHCIWLGTCIGKKNHCRFWWVVSFPICSVHLRISCGVLCLCIHYHNFCRNTASKLICLIRPLMIILRTLLLSTDISQKLNSSLQ
jgi:hypothetical protein